MAPKKIKTTYHNGVLEPKESLILPDGEEVTLIIESPPGSSGQSDLGRLRAAAGSWKEITDETLEEDIYKLRGLKTRSGVESW